MRAGRFKASLNCLSLLACLAFAGTAKAAEITSAVYSEPTARYAHGVLGDAIEYGALELTMSDGTRYTLTLAQSQVFEDIAPRLADVDLDGSAEVITVESNLSRGARLSIYDETGLVAATPYIGQIHRWLAPVGAADLDGDGSVEIAYIDRPHLAKTLRIWRFENGFLTEIATATGLTNHRIGWDFIAGGIRDCGQGPEMITASADWADVVSTSFTGNGTLESDKISSYESPKSLNTALICP